MTGISIVSDGWEDGQRRPLLNIVEVSPRGAMFVKAVDTSGETKDAGYIAERLIEAINDAGSELVVQVVTDSASVCKSAGELVEKAFPHVTWAPCTAHVLDLFLEDVGKIPSITDVIDEGREVVK